MDLGKTKKVYVVEDDISLSTLMDRVLMNIDSELSLDWATSAEEAIEVILLAKKNKKPKPYDLIIIDIFLEGPASGIALWLLVKKEFPDIPVLLTSSNHLGDIIMPQMELPEIPVFLMKPFSMLECKRVFKNLLQI